MFLTMYVDDIVLYRNNLDIIEATKKQLCFIFEMKDMGEARYVLDVEIHTLYIDDILLDENSLEMI